MTITDTDAGLIPPLAATATFSPCRSYRYRLDRVWRTDRPPVCFVMLNPSTADALRLDPTVRRCVGFAERWGHGSLRVVNLFALRATDPADMVRAACPADPLGRAGDNDQAVREAASGVRVIVAWGVHGDHLDAGRAAVGSLAEVAAAVECLGVTKGGHPRHPLYVPGHAVPVPFNIEARP